MAIFSVTASELKNASGSSWSSDRARQGVYGSTRYEGAINFSGLADFDMSNISITQIDMSVTFAEAGGCSGKYLTFYKSAKTSIGGTIASMRGDSIGRLYVAEAYGRTEKLTFNASTNAELFASFRDYFMTGNRILIIYVPSTRGTYSGGYCYDYLSITGLTMTFTFDYLQSDGSLASASVAAGSAATLNITSYNTAYSHKVTWKFGSYSNVQTVAAGTAKASYTIPLTWLNAIPSATSGTATATLDTLDASGNSLGTKTYNFTITAPASVVPTISSVTAAPVNSNSVINGWGIYVYSKSQAKLTITGAAGKYGSTIKSYSITTSPSVGSSTDSSFTTGTLYSSGSITVTAKVTDSRGRTATKTTSFSVYDYAAPYFSSIEAYRCTSNGTQNDISGTYARLKVTFGRYTLSGSNNVTCKAVLAQVGGSYSTSATLTSGTAVTLGGGNLAVDAVYRVTLNLTDTVGTVSTYITEIGSAAYVMHVKKGGKAIGFGKAAGDDETVSFGWPLKLDTALEVAEGGTGAVTAAAARTNLGITLANLGAASSGHTHALTASAITGTLPVAKGGTGATTVAAARNALGLGNTSGAVPIANGGTGATTAANARTNLGITAATISDTSTFIGSVYFYIGSVLIQMGITDTISAPSKGTVDTVITFPKAYTVIPKVMVSDYYNNTTYSYIIGTKSVAAAVTTTALTIRTANETSGARSVRASWLAIGY